MSIDLHIHSIYSDGTHTPSELVHLATVRKLQSISLTDHDTIAGLEECIEAGKIAGVEVIPGIELSVEHKDVSLHLLGYFFDFSNEELNAKVAVLQDARKKRNFKIVKRLNTLGIDISMEEIETISKTGQTGRPHIARVLMQKGIVSSMDEAFDRYLARGAVAYESRFVYSAEEAIGIIGNGGGISVLAHPTHADSSYSGISSIVGELAEIGLDGIEVYYPSYSSSIRKKLKAIAKKHNMVISGGSDYHGEVRPGSELAGGRHVHVPVDVLERLRTRLHVKRNKAPEGS